MVKAVVCVDELHYTHDDTSRRFRDGRFLDETVCALKDPEAHGLDILKDPNFVLDTVVYDSKYYS